MLLYQEDAELLFPARLIPAMRDMRGDAFRDLVDRVTSCESEIETEALGFSLMMVRLASCLTCTADSYRAMNGCTQCSAKTIRGFKGSDQDLVALWQTACEDIRLWQATGERPNDL